MEEAGKTCSKLTKEDCEDIINELHINMNKVVTGIFETRKVVDTAYFVTIVKNKAIMTIKKFEISRDEPYDI